MKARPYKKGSQYCDLCLSEKTIIAIADKRSLNKRNEMLRKCTHMNPYKLSTIPIEPTTMQGTSYMIVLEAYVLPYFW